MGWRGTARTLEALSNKVDVVLLVSSVLLTKDVKHDLTDRIRSDGFGAYSMALGGYGPFQYRDAYR